MRRGKVKRHGIIATWQATRQRNRALKQFCESYKIKPAKLSLAQIKLAIRNIPPGRPREMAIMAYEMLEGRMQNNR